MVPLSGIGGACFLGIVLEGSELYQFPFEDELSMVIPGELVRLVLEPFFVAQC